MPSMEVSNVSIDSRVMAKVIYRASLIIRPPLGRDTPLVFTLKLKLQFMTDQKGVSISRDYYFFLLFEHYRFGESVGTAN